MKTLYEPPLSLLVKLGSIAVHVDELLSAKEVEMPSPVMSAVGNAAQFDIAAIRTLLADPELKHWIAAMDNMGWMPKKR